MRVLFLVLLLANVAFFAWARYYSHSEGAANEEAVTREIQPERLRIVPPAEAPARPSPAPKPAGPTSQLPPASCLEWGAFTSADAARAHEVLQPLALGKRLAQRRTEELATWWVFMPPQGSRQAALRKSSELKALGVRDYYVLPDEGEWRWALSLGVYRTEEGAHARLAALQAQGVRDALVAPRESVVPKLWLQIRDIDPLLQTSLEELAPKIPGSELRTCR